MSPATPKAEATRNRILQAADRLFYRHGYHATGLDAIIREAGVTKGNFYYYFESKEALALAVLEWHFELTSQETRTLLDEQKAGPLDSLFLMLEGIAGRQHAQADEGALCGCLFGNFTLEMSADSDPVRRKVASIFDRYRKTIASLLRQARKAGELPAEIDPDSQAHVILSLIEGAILLDKSRQRIEALPKAIDFLRRMLPAAASQTQPKI